MCQNDAISSIQARNRQYRSCLNAFSSILGTTETVMNPAQTGRIEPNQECPTCGFGNPEGASNPAGSRSEGCPDPVTQTGNVFQKWHYFESLETRNERESGFRNPKESVILGLLSYSSLDCEWKPIRSHRRLWTSAVFGTLPYLSYRSGTITTPMTRMPFCAEHR